MVREHGLKGCLEIKKKKYNPFKMWGSWVGFVIGWFAGALEFARTARQSLLDVPGIDYRILVMCAVLGFFVGWGVHSLFRRFLR